MTLGDVRSHIEEKGILTVCDPAVGAGALVIASAEEIASQGINPAAHVQFDCTDVSRDAFNMTYIQLSAQNLQAMVHYGNSLSQEFWEHRPTLQLRLFQQWAESKRKEQQHIQAMRSLFSGESSVCAVSDEEADVVAVATPSETLFDLTQFAGECETTKRPRRAHDIVLDRQMSLFG